MPRAMDHPLYRYTPLSVERKAQLRLSQRRRLGIPDGMARLCGIHVPIEHADLVRHDAYWICYNVGLDEARDFIEKVKTIDWNLVGEFLHEFAGYQQIAQFFGVPWWYVEKKTDHLKRIPRGIIRGRKHGPGLWNE